MSDGKFEIDFSGVTIDCEYLGKEVKASGVIKITHTSGDEVELSVDGPFNLIQFKEFIGNSSKKTIPHLPSLTERANEMTTYSTYQEAKIANPDSEIYLDESVFRTWRHDQIKSGTKCNPADYCMTVEKFLADGHKFVEGDVFMNALGDVVEVGKWYQSIRIEPKEANLTISGDENHHILRAAALEEMIDKESKDGELWEPAVELVSVIAKGDGYCLYKQSEIDRLNQTIEDQRKDCLELSKPITITHKVGDVSKTYVFDNAEDANKFDSDNNQSEFKNGDECIIDGYGSEHWQYGCDVPQSQLAIVFRLESASHMTIPRDRLSKPLTLEQKAQQEREVNGEALFNFSEKSAEDAGGIMLSIPWEEQTDSSKDYWCMFAEKLNFKAGE